MNQAPAHSSTALASHHAGVTSAFRPYVATCAAKALLGFFVLIVMSIQLMAQDTAATEMFTIGPALKKSDSADYAKWKLKFSNPATPSLTSRQIKKRVTIIATTNIVGYSAAMAGLYAAWYKDYPQSNFHAFNDIGEWKGIDKIGHAYSAYAESKASMELWRWTGIDRKKRIWLGGMSGALYQTVIETLDGFSSEWGWSWGDFGANMLGSGMLVAQELAWDEQRIQFKFSFHHKSYSDAVLNQRSNTIFGKSTAERFLKDYNGQTYWLSANIKSFFPHSKLPAWLQVSVGTGAEGLFGATENIGKDAAGTIVFSRPNIKRYRQWYLAPDIDLTKIKTKHKGFKVALNILNIVKFPMPSLEYSNGKFKLNAVTF